MRVRNSLTVAISALLLITGATSTGAAPEAKEVYLIKFADNVNLGSEISALKAAGDEVRFEYRNVFKGAAVAMNSARAEALSRNPRVEIIELDGIVTKDETRSPAVWGLSRIDERSLNSTANSYSYTTTGAGVTAYIIDSGIFKHGDFSSRLLPGYTSIQDGRGTDDCDGHGTHVAGTVGGNTYGVAKGVSLVPVRVLDCNGSGSWSGVIAGLDWIRSAANPHGKTKAVANMSLGGGVSTSVNAAVASLVKSGITVVVAAGNSNRDACRFSPASERTAFTVGATDSNDARASYSNIGVCLDIFAPGTGITSSWIGSATATSTISGTSMASPHVAGVVARYLQSATNTAPESVMAEIRTQATLGKVKSAGKGSPNLLLFRDPNS